MISYAAIMAVLFIGVGVFMNRSYANTVRTNTIDSNINRLETLRLQHEEKLNTLAMIGSQISVSYYISPFKLEEEPMKAYHLKQQLAPYAITSDFCDQLFLIFNEDEYVYSAATTMPLDLFVNNLVRYDNTTPQALRMLLRREDNRITILPSQPMHSILTDGTHHSMVTVFVPLMMGNHHNTGNIMFLIDDSKYQRMFSEAVYEPRSTYIFYRDNVLAANRGLPLDDATILGELGENEGTLVRDLTVDGHQYLLIAQKGAQYDMQYVSVVSHESMKESMTRSQLGFGLFLFVLSIPCSILTIYFARKHAKPIRELRLLFGPTVAAQDDLEAIQSGIAELVESNETLHVHLSETIPTRRASFVAAFVKGRYRDRADAVAQAASLTLDIDRPRFLVALIDETREETGQMDIDRVIACGEGQVTGYGVQLVALEQYLFVVFADTDEELDRWAWQVKSQLQSEQGTLAIAVSNAYDDFDRAATAYLEASTAYDNRFVMGSANVLRFADVSAAAKDIVPFTRTYLDGFRKALRARDAKALNERIQELFQYLTNTELSLFAFRMIYNSVIDVLLGEHFSQDDGDMDALSYYDVFTLSSCRSIDDLDDILRKLCRDILSSEGKNAPPVHPLIRDIIAYMNEHFTDPALSMSAIADEYGISAVRLSLDFKEITSMSPSDYLLLLRMEKAKELLAMTETSIKDIGVAVGYYDASGFIRRFKKYTAMTPAQYRKTIAKKDESGQEP